MSVLLQKWPNTIEIRRWYEASEIYGYSQTAGISFPPLEGARDCVMFFSREDAVAYLRRIPLRQDDISRLRSLLAGEFWGVYRLSDHEVIDQVAVRLAQRTLSLVETAVRQESVSYSAVPEPRRQEMPQRPTPQPPRVGTPSPAPSQPPPEANPLDEIDHDAQAVTLEAAAQGGVPFCAECEKARRNREAAAKATS